MSAHRRPESLVPSNEAFAQLPDRLAGVRPRAAATVRRLLDASALLFADRGYHGTGVDDVVAEAGFARGTFYKYFDEKLDLLLQLTRECSGDMRVLIARKRSSSATTSRCGLTRPAPRRSAASSRGAFGCRRSCGSSSGWPRPIPRS